VLGGLVTTYLALNTVSDGAGMWEGMEMVYNAAPDRFVMILDESNQEHEFQDRVLVGGLWVQISTTGIQSIYYSKNFAIA
jgi:SSS family solute:Na+ symporter